MPALCVVMAFAVAPIFLSLAACTVVQPTLTGTGTPNLGSRERAVRERAQQVLEALASMDGNRLAVLVHPQKGVRFSPSAYVDTANDVVFTRAQIQRFWSDNQSYTWGYAEATGDAISLTPKEYYRKYILNRNFLASSIVSVDHDRANGTTTNNAASVYPEGTRVEYYIESSVGAKQSQLDWAALRLVFEQVGGTWYLVAIIHDEWAP